MSGAQQQPSSDGKSEDTGTDQRLQGLTTPSFNEFDRNFKRLLDLSDEILKKNDTRTLNLSEEANSTLECLVRYRRCYLKTKPDEREEMHVSLFRKVYDMNKTAIIDDGHKNTSWLKDGDITIQYGSNFGLVNFIIVDLSEIFRIACKLRDETKLKLEGASDEEYQTAKELNYPDAYMLYIYRIFKSWPHESSEETVRLNIIITAIEKDLGITSETSDNNPLGEEGLGGLMNFAQGMFDNMGIKPPEGSTQPNQADIGKALGNVFNNPNTQTAISGMFEGLGNSNNIGDVIGKLVGGFSDPALTQAIGDSLNEAANDISTSRGDGADSAAGSAPQADAAAGTPNSQAAIAGASQTVDVSSSQGESQNSSQVPSEIPIISE